MSAQSADNPPAASSSAIASSDAWSATLHDGLQSYAKGDFSGALEKFQQVLQQKPNSPDGYAGMTRVYLKQKNLDLASETIGKGLAANQDAPVLQVVQGEVFFREGRITDAEREWVKVVNSGYPSARAFLGLARVRDAIGLHHSARLMIEKAHQLDPNDPDIQRRWINTLGREERIKYLQEMLAGPSNDDPETVLATRHYLEYLLARQKERGGNCRLGSSVTSTQADLQRLYIDPEHIRGYGLTVELNGHKSSLMLDTGASGILVDQGIAEKAGITRLSQTRISGIGDQGSKTGWIGVAGSIKIGNLEFHDCPVEVMEKRSVVGEEGLIGADVFDDFLVDLDFPNEKLRLSQLPQRPDEASHPLKLKSEGGADNPEEASNSDTSSGQAGKPTPDSGPQDAYIAPEMKTYTRIYRFGHALLVPTKIGDTPSKLFLLDTGAVMNHITPRAAREVTKVHGDTETIIKGVSGRVNNVYSADKAILQFGHLRQENQDLVSFDMNSLSDDLGTEVSGTLGFVMLRLLDVKIDYRDDLVNFDYKPR